MYFLWLRCLSLRFKDRWQNWFLHCPTSDAVLESAENEILSFLESPYKVFFVNIGPAVEKEDFQIRTLCMNVQSKKSPIVLLHGLGHGIGLWALNLDSMAAERPVYAIDLPGFGRSSRHYFSTDAAEAENQMVNCLEAWRNEMKLDNFILLGFSLGGFVATSYAFSYSNRVLHLILVDPWGFPKSPTTFKEIIFGCKGPLPVHPLVGSIGHFIFRPFNPLLCMRLAGKLRIVGHKVIRAATMLEEFSIFGESAVEKIIHYIIHCNAQKPTGEAAMYSMSSTAGIFWAMFPMNERISKLRDKEMPLTLIYGTKSWLCKMPVQEFREILPNSYVDEQIIDGAGHDCFMHDSKTFNKLLIKIIDTTKTNLNDYSGSEAL